MQVSFFSNKKRRERKQNFKFHVLFKQLGNIVTFG